MTRFSLATLRDELIPAARRAADPVAALQNLYEESGSDGVVAEALGSECERLGRLSDALDWFEEAERRYWDPAFKSRPRQAAARVRAMIGEGPPARGADERTLYVVSCTASKAWDDGHAGTPRYVPAELAYQGQWPRTWRESAPAKNGARWLFLSAKYGFIEPDHPIRNYDVTFSRASTGPMDGTSLAAQVTHQTRWADQVPLRDFNRVVVFGSDHYVEVTRRAFEAQGAHVSQWSPEGVGDGRPVPESDRPKVDRVGTVGRALRGLSRGVYDAADRQQPEWPTLGRMADLPSGVDVVLTLALSLSNYQLGPGRAVAYWRETDRLLERGVLQGRRDVYQFMEALMGCPVAARHAQAKLARVERLLSSGIPQEVAGGVASVRSDALWRSLTAAMGGDSHAKTVVFAVKTVGLLHLHATGERMDLPTDLPIPVDIRIARVSLAAGLISPPPACFYVNAGWVWGVECPVGSPLTGAGGVSASRAR